MVRKSTDAERPLILEAVRLRTEERLTLKEIATRLSVSRSVVTCWLECEGLHSKNRGKHPARVERAIEPSPFDLLDRFLATPLGSGVPSELLSGR